MKQIWTKFKNWLIIKLGGYLKETKVIKVSPYGKNPIVCEAILEMDAIVRKQLDSDLDDILKTELIQKLLPQIKANLEVLECFSLPDVYKYRGRLYFLERD